MQKQLRISATSGMSGFARRLRIGLQTRTLAACLLAAGGLFAANSAQAQTTLLSEGFETGLNGWTLVNGTQTNQFVVGTAAASAGTQSAYVSNDAGVTNTYTITAASVVHIYKDVVIPATQKNIQLTFKWRTVGEGASSDWDNLKVFLVAPTATITAGAELPAANKIGAAWYNLSSATAYTTTTISFPNTLSGTTQRLVFSWKNDGSDGVTPPVSIDDIAFTSVAAVPLSGVYTINNILPTAGTNYASFTDAITALNNEGITGPVTFNVSAGQTFTENAPAITTSGTSVNTVMFQKSGTGANPMVRPTGTTASNEAGIILTGVDYYTFDGIDINISTGSAVEYGYLLRNASATDGAMNNTIRNASITLNKANTSSIGVLQTSSTSFGVGITPTVAAGGNQNNTYTNLSIQNVYNGMLLVGGSGTFLDNNNTVSNNTVGGATAGDLAGGTTTAYGIKATLQNNVKIFNNEVRNITTTTAAIDGIFLDQGLGIAEIYRNRIHDNAISTATATAVNAGMRINTYTTTIGHSTRVYNNFVYGLTHAFNSATVSASRRIIGIFVQSNGTGLGNTHNIDFNSVRIEPAATYTASSAVFEIGTTSGPVINVRNNIFANFSGAQTGVAKHYVWVSTSATLTGLAGSVSNNNLLYIANATNGYVGLGGTADRITLGNWYGSTNQDQNSKSSNPQFISATDLHISPTAPTEVESSGSYFGGAISWVTTDIDNATRNTSTPDLGADEGTFVPTDLSGPVITYTPLSRTSLLTNRTLTATIIDPSGVPTTGNLVPRIYFSKALVLAGFVSTPGVLTSGTATNGTWTFTIDYSLLGGVVATDQIAYYVVAQDNLGNIGSTPGGISGTDVNTITGGSNVFTYTFGASIPAVVTVPGTYPSLTLAGGLFAAINAGVMSSNVVVQITGDLTAETGLNQLNRWAEEGTGNYTLTIRPDGATNRTISGVGATAGQGLIRIVSAERVTFDGSFNGTGRYLTLTNTGATTPVTLQIAFATNVTIKNLNISTGINNAASTAIVSNSGNNPNLILENNNITRAYTGISVSPPATSLNTGLIIRNNIIGSATPADYVAFRGISLTNATLPLVTGNNVSVKTGLSVNIAGIEIGAGVTEVKIDANTISGVSNTSTSGYGAYGINILTGVGHTISNNMISDINMFNYSNTTTTWNPFGIRIEGGTNHKIYHNNINLFGPLQAPTATHFSADILVLNATSTGLDIRNNIFANTVAGIASGKSYTVYAPSGTTFANINYNNYYVSGINGVIGYLGADKLTLADWKTATGQDVNSISVEPLFTSPTDLHLESSNLALNNAGTPIAAVTTDFDNQPRSTTTPDIGADEFTPAALDLGIATLIAPTAKNCFNAAEQVIVRLENLGISPVNFTATNANVVVNVTGAATQTFTVVLNNNNRNGGQPLAPGDTLDIIVGSLNMSALGVYTFNATSNVLTGGIDGNLTNNGITPVNITVSAPDAGTATASLASICQSGITTLSVAGNIGGDIKWQSATSATGPFTDIAGATGPSYTLTTPITATTYYQAVATCGTNSDNSNVVTVTVNNPTIASVAGDSRCGTGTVNLTATPASGTIVWFDVATGGIPVATGNTYSPNVTATTTYYAEAIVGNTFNAGLPGTGAYGTFGSPGGIGYGLTITTTQPGVIESAYVYPVSAGNVVVQLYTRAGVAVGNPVTVAVSASDIGNKTLIPLNIPVLVPGNYNLVNITGSVFLNRYNPYSGPAYPLNSAGNVFSITGGATSASSTPGPTTYYSFFDITFSNACRSARQSVVATVNPLPVPTITGLNATYCVSDPVVTLTGGIAGSTFTVNGTAATTFNPATLGAGTHTIVVSSTNAQNCTGTATQTVTVTAPAATPTITAAGSTTICAGSNVVLTAASTTTGATYQWFDNGTAIPSATSATYTATAAGTYTVVATANGCASTASTATVVTVTPLPTTPTITQTGGTLTSSAATGNQWFLNGTVIPGATGATYVTTANGPYTVQVTANGCTSALSAVTNVTNTGIADALAGMSVQVYPNPASGSFNVKLNGYQKDANVVLYNLAGQQITKANASADGNASNINIKGLAAGTYLLKVTSDKGVQVSRLIVQ